MRKQRNLLILSLTLLFVTASTVFGTNAPAETADPINLIEQAYQAGDIDINTKATLVIRAIKSPETLPSNYQTDAVVKGELSGRSATMAIVDIKNHWDELTTDAQTEFSVALGRPSGGNLYLSPSGYFLLHYNTAGGDAIPITDADASGYPDFIEKIATYCDTSLTKHIELGYRLPPSDGINGGDSLFDVYFESMPYYGYAVPEDPGPEPWNDATSYLVLHNTYIGFPANDDPEGNQAGAAKVTAAHEFHHCCQFAYDYGEQGWFMELDATYFEDIVFDLTNDNYNYLPAYLADPESSLMLSTATGYFRFIWGLYLAAAYDTSLMEAAWEGGRYTTAFQAIADTLAADYGTSMDASFLEYTLWNYFTGTRDLGLHYEEGSFYPTLATAFSYGSYPVVETLCPDPVDGYAASYIVFNSIGNVGTLHLTFRGSIVRTWGAYVIMIPSGGGSYSTESIPLDANHAGSFQLDNFENYERVILVAVNLDEYGGSSSFYYSADVVEPFLYTTEILSDTNVYPGELKYFDYKVTNYSGQGDVLDIYFHDSEGWGTPVAQNHYVSNNTSVTARLPLYPSDSVPFDSTTDLIFRVQLRSNPVVGADDILLGRAVPKRGDVNSDDKVNLSDITTLIAYVYLQGTAPTPQYTGDFSCDGKYNLTDITMVISYVYLDGSKSPCDSYEH